MGWIRAIKYVRLRVLRVADTTHKVAGGLASGTCVSFTPLVGTHFIQAATLAYILRVNVFTAVIGTFVGNPWTFPFMWWVSFYLGDKIFSLLGYKNIGVMPDHITMDSLWEMIKTDPMNIFLPWLVGGYLAAALAWPIFYCVFYILVRSAKEARRKARLMKVQRVARELTQEH